MQFHPLLFRVAVPLAGLALAFAAWRSYGWPGVATVGTAGVMWGLLHVNRMLQVLKRAANRPVGYVDSAVMLNAKLRAGMTLLHVLAMTKALGELQSAAGQQPEVFRWTDATQSQVDAEFRSGRLVRWSLVRPQQAQASAADRAPSAELTATGSAAP